MSCTKKINENSPLALNSALSIFTVPPTNVSVVRSFFREILPLSTITQDSPYLFRLFSDNLWTDLSRTYLYLELSIEKLGQDNKWSPIVATDTSIAPIQGIGQTFVQQLKVTLAYITNELSFPDNVKSNFLASIGYYKCDKHDDSTDSGFQKRCSLFANGKHTQFLSRLDFDLGNQELFLLNNLDVNFNIYRSKNSFALQRLNATDEVQYRLYVHDVKLFVKMIEVQPSLNMNIYKTLESKPATYAVRKTEIKSTFLTAGRTEIEYNAFSASIPRRITVALISNKAFNGDFGLSPFNFQPYDLRDISVHTGGHIFPLVAYKLKFKNNLFVRAFVDMYEALGVANSDRSIDISMDKFKNGWTFFVIPLTSTLDDSCGFELLRSGTTSIRLEFNTPIPAGGVEMIVLGEFDQMLMIDYNRHIVSDSNLG
uniref:Uncharacterized protein n=1 Tax=Meloidogyne enterolobii TaxID=390850 RepID=A0A6V7U5Q9_MELEN|nr:unnamed protein product [Meloidogyne enterolobii]